MICPFPSRRAFALGAKEKVTRKHIFPKRLALVKSTHLTVSLISAVTVLSRWNKVSSDEAVALISRDI